MNIYLAVDRNEYEFMYPVEPFRNNDNNTWIIDKVHMCTEQKRMRDVKTNNAS